MNRDFKGIWIPKVIWENKELSWGEKLLFVEIDSLAKNGECFASNDHFSDFLSLSTRQVQNYLAGLQQKGFISIQLFYKGNTKIVTKRIISPIHKFTDEENFTRTDEESFAHMDEENFTRTDEENFVGSNTISFNNTKSNTKDLKTNKKNSASNSEYENEFETLWAMYPKKQGKKLALSQYIKARKTKKYTYETIKLGLEMYIRHLEQEGTDDKFIKAGKTWFNEGWLDEYGPSPLNRKPKSLNEYLRQKHGGTEHEQVRDRKIVDLYPQNLPEPFQGF